MIAYKLYICLVHINTRLEDAVIVVFLLFRMGRQKNML